MNVHSNLYFYTTKKQNINKLLYNYNNIYFTLICALLYFSISHKCIIFNNVTQAFSYFFLQIYFYLLSLIQIQPIKIHNVQIRMINGKCIEKLIKFNRLIYLKIFHFNHCYYIGRHFGNTKYWYIQCSFKERNRMQNLQ